MTITTNYLIDKKVIVTCGSGGVGKTSVSAAIAMHAAMIGKRSIVLTIDPARRLATSMGLATLTDEPNLIDPSLFPRKPAGELYAMMLDPKRTFDRVVERYAPDKKTKEAIFSNRLYQLMSNMMAGSQEYMAMERLHEIYHEGDYDLIVLDTPPTRNALNFLEAPKRMVDMTGNSALRLFLRPGLFAGRVGFRIFRKSADHIFNLFDELAGITFLRELAEMIFAFGDLIGGFGTRAKDVFELLRGDDVGFVLVTVPESLALKDALYFSRKIDDFRLPMLGFIMNRIHPDYVSGDDIEKEIGGLPEGLRDLLARNAIDFQKLHERHRDMIEWFRLQCIVPILCEIPFFETDVHNMEGLARIASHFKTV